MTTDPRLLRQVEQHPYHETPCGGCRFDAAKLLVQRKVAPAWLTEECRWDCVSDTRQLSGGPSKA